MTASMAAWYSDLDFSALNFPNMYEEEITLHAPARMRPREVKLADDVGSKTSL